METIVILARALAKASLSEVSSLEIIFDGKEDSYFGKLILVNTSEYTIYESGEIKAL